MLRERGAKRVKDLRCFRPVLQPDERSPCVVFGRRPDAGGRRCRANPEEVMGGRAIVLRLVCELTLLVDRCSEIVDERGARLVTLRRDRQYLGITFFGLRVLGELERSVRNDNPRGTPDS